MRGWFGLQTESGRRPLQGRGMFAARPSRTASARLSGCRTGTGTPDGRHQLSWTEHVDVQKRLDRRSHPQWRNVVELRALSGRA
ncbi:hypothetical protein GCM10009534_38360 [Kribbella sandramycini]